MAGGVVGRTRGGTSPRLGCNDGEETVRVEEDKGVGESFWSFTTSGMMVRFVHVGAERLAGEWWWW